MYRKAGTRIFVALVVLGTLLCLFPPSRPFFLWWEAQASNYMIALLVAGMGFFIFNMKTRMTVSLLCCGIICFFIHTRTETSLTHAVLTKEGMDFSAAHLKLPPDESKLDILLDRVRQYHPDLLSLQDLQEEQIYRVHQFLTHQGYEYFLPFKEDDKREKLAVYSRYPFDFVRQINQRDDASITGRIRLPEHLSYSFLQFTTVRPGQRARTPAYLRALAQQVRSWNSPALALGDFSCVPWALSLSAFKRNTSLLDSRRVVEAATAGEYMGLSEKPTVHILHSEHLQCIDFDIIRDEDLDLIGIMGTYQLAAEGKPDVPQKN